MLTDKLTRVSIAHLPTPLEPLPRLSAQLGGPELWIKRDDQTGLATGGNKARKLEFLVADALAHGADMLITGGATQSNHARQTAAAAARFGLDCTLVLRGTEPAMSQGNLLLDRIVGANVVWAGTRPLDEVMDEVGANLRSTGHQPYVIPYGGSNPIGASGYVAAMEELLEQCRERGISFDHIVFASSSSGTQAGIVVGATALGFKGTILGISVDLGAEILKTKLTKLANATASHLDLSKSFAAEDFTVNDCYLGMGYGVFGDLERDAILMLARTEGILLDPVYTGRAFGGLLDLIGQGCFAEDDRILFWHTGGTSSLFSYAEQFRHIPT